MKPTLKGWAKSNVGAKCRFQDGRVYQLQANGEIRRLSPTRHWRGKSERRQVIKARRAKREAAGA